ncbi:PhzF family phenazine biosynthesis protein [Aurantiacibacter suaedae]|uniref:PhzF family phenazine biosynthesis protein n=1 Tax=Aurantiacibacter suaedae TaxID=2545755 RepID=UPI0010F4F1AD|nr:PhzF family phenazine biosynthesis protein [Aurantiacibacter suaedae]
MTASPTNRVPYVHVDAFASRAFGGNQAAVMVLGEWLPDALLQQIAAENMFAETAFLVATPGGAAEFELRWFAPECEVALCGHATLAAGHVVLRQDAEREVIRFATRKAGVLAVSRADEGYEMALPAIATDDEPPAGIAEGLGKAPAELAWSAKGYLIARYDSEAEVRALAPDMAQLASHGDAAFIATARGQKADVVSRVFVPGAGIPEDSVTGSAHAALARFWAPRLGKEGFSAHQASERGGDLGVRLAGDKAMLTGQCVTVAEGLYYLPG